MSRGARLMLAWPAVLVGIAVVGHAGDPDPLVAAPLRPAVDRDLRTYRFAARVTANGGVTPFEVGAVVKGTVTYDLRGKDRVPDLPESGKYDSKRNAFSARLGDLEFRGAGPVVASASAFARSEHVGVVAHDMVLPAGWDMDHENPSDSYGVMLQNAPPRKVLPGKGLPDKVRLADFKNTRDLRLDFFRGVKFPGGEAKGRATVHATLEEFEEVQPVRR